MLYADNRGYAAAHNIALRWLTDHATDLQYDTIGFLNNDLLMSEGLLDDLYSVLWGDDQVGAVAPQQMDDDGNVIRSGFTLCGRWHDRYRHRPCDPEGPWADVDLIKGPLFFVKAVAQRKIGAWNESYFHYFDDDDLSLRLHRTGYRLCVLRRCVRHRCGSSLDYCTPTAQYYFIRNRLLFLKDHFGLCALDASVRNSIRCAVALRTRMERSSAMPVAAYYGLRDGVLGRRGRISEKTAGRLVEAR